jgi:AAA family ATP:ADP antiporter
MATIHAPAVPAPASRSALERLLCIFTDVRPGEGVTAVAMVANVFLILCAYYFVKPLRDGWIAVSDVRGLSSMEVKAYTSFAQGIVLMGVVALYGQLAARLARRQLIIRSTLFCMSNLVLFWLLRPRGETEPIPHLGIVFYVWVGMFGVFVVAQFWAFAADLYSEERGNRLLPLVAIGATAGAAAGSMLTEPIAHSAGLGSDALLLAANLPLAGSVLLTAFADTRGERADDAPAAGAAAAPAAGDAAEGGALALIARHPYLLAVAVASLLMSWVGTNGENLLFKVVQDALAAEIVARDITDKLEMKQFLLEWTTAFYGNFFFWVNIFALGAQALLASRLLRYGGFGVILLLLPVLSVLSYSAMALLPILLVVQVMKTAENGTSYSINNTARHVLWLPTTAAMKYRAKPAVDTFFVRLGDGLAALTTLVGVRFLVLSTRSFFAVNVALAAAWLVVALVVLREYRRLAAG